MKAFCKAVVVKILTWEARLVLHRHTPTIVAITGSVGKTATKDAIYGVLKGHYRVRKSEKSFNSEIGVPLTVLGLTNAWSNPFGWLRNILHGFFIAVWSRSYPEILVLEAGVDAKGDMATLTSWLTPHYVVLTRLPDIPVHVEHFSTPAEVVTEKMQLVHGLAPDGVLIYNHDDMIIREQLSNVRQKAIGYARYSDAPYRISQDTTVYHDDIPTGTRFHLAAPEDESATITVRGCLGMQSAYVYTAAAVVGREFAVPLETIATSLAEHTPPPGRMRVLPGIKGTVIIDDTYNSSPVAAESALHTLNELRYAKRKIAVLGDMLELGRYSVEQHKRIGVIAAQTTDLLLTAGVRARGFAEGALAHGMPESQIFQYENIPRAGRELQALLQPGDVILIKGSQSGIRLERVVEEIMQEPERATELLVRQSPEWKRKV